jgi:alkylation response protein AidB-like acyl-CoA dehydrogenase
VDLVPSPDQEQIVDAARVFLARELPVQHARWEPDALHARDRALLPRFGELGWYGMGLAEEAGGVGFTACEEMLLFREAGRFLVTPILLFSTISANLALAHGATELVGGLLTGETRCGLAVQTPDQERFLLIEGADASLILHLTEDRLMLKRREAYGTVSDVRSIDDTVTLQSAHARSGEPVAIVSGDVARMLTDHMSLLIAAMLVGAAEATRDLTVGHAGERSQFGQKIGSFQAVSHPCADMAVRCEAALSQTKFAAVAVASGREDAEYQVRAARIVALDAALSNATASVQLHGGMGFAAEYPVHLFLKRAMLLNQIGDAQPEQLDRFLRLGYPRQ